MRKGHACTHVRFMFSLRILLIAGALTIGSSSVRVEAGVWDIIKQYYATMRLGEFNDGNIPETPVENAGEVGLQHIRSVEIPFGDETPGIGMVRWIGITPEGSLLITDEVGSQAHEFSLDDGHYIRSFGRQGSGPGEYLLPENMAIDTEGRVYLLDRTRGAVLRYDRQGHFLDKTGFVQGCRVVTGRDGELFFLWKNPLAIMELQRRDPATWKVLYRTPLSTRKQNFTTYWSGHFSQLCYSAASHRLYYLGRRDYKVKEINADTNEVIRKFGQRPEGFISLPEKYHGVGRGTRDDYRRLSNKISEVNSMTLLQDRYLLIMYDIEWGIPKLWVVYDLDSQERIRVYFFDQDGKERLESLVNSRDTIPVAAWRNRLYMWRVPPPEVAERSNGTVEVYCLTFDRSVR